MTNRFTADPQWRRGIVRRFEIFCKAMEMSSIAASVVGNDCRLRRPSRGARDQRQDYRDEERQDSRIGAARLAGISVDRIKILLFTVQGMMAGGAGIILSSRMTSRRPNSSVGFALDGISACVLGGAEAARDAAPVRCLGTSRSCRGRCSWPRRAPYLRASADRTGNCPARVSPRRVPC